MKTVLILVIVMIVLASCTNSPTLSGVNNNDTVELKDEFGRDAYPEIKPDSVLKDSLPR